MAEPAKRAPVSGSDGAAAVATPFGFAGLYVFASFVLPQLGSRVFVPLERRSLFPVLLFCAFTLWIYVEIVRANEGLRKPPQKAAHLPFWAVAHLLFIALLGWTLSFVVLAPMTFVFSLLTALAARAGPHLPYFERVLFDLLFAVSLALAAAGFLPLARRLGLTQEPSRPSLRWTLYAALVGAGSLVIAVVALLGRVNPMYYRRLFLPPVEG